VTFALLADENFPGPVIDGLVAAGHDVLSIARTTQGIDDRSVLDLARQTGRRLLTFDSDFGDLVFFHAVPPPVAILYFRMHPIIIEDVLEAALHALIETPEGYFAVVGREGIRLRPLRPGHKVE
jgi:predicted nuclease of predicted toxin-antitoxin system